MAAILLDRVDKTYANGYPAVQAVTLDIQDGELLVLVGPSGCGKSTLLRLVAGLEQISAGTLRIGGRRANELSPRERNIAMVFQDYALYPTMTVRANLEFPLRMKKHQPLEIRKRVDWAADLLDLKLFMDRLPKQLSGGQRQRVAMGRAIVREPSVFLLDEPLSNLDAKLRSQVRSEIAELQRRMGTTMIYVTHDQVEAMTLGHRIAVMADGQLQQVANPETLYRAPANPFVAGFLGSPPMNVFMAQIAQDENGQTNMAVGGETIAQVAAMRFPPGKSPIQVGIRPECLQLARNDGSGFPARVTGVEFLGHETLVHVVPGSKPSDTPTLIARLAGMHRLAPGDLVRLSVIAEDVYRFPNGAPEPD